MPDHMPEIAAALQDKPVTSFFNFAAHRAATTTFLFNDHTPNGPERYAPCSRIVN